MKPLKILVIVKNRLAAQERAMRPMGMWSYPVPQFEWDFLHPGKSFTLDTRAYEGRYDVIFHEDGGAWGDYIGGAVPVVYHAIDSTLSENHHYFPRLKQASKADLILVDHDRLERFKIHNKPVERLSHAVNDLIFKDYGEPKATDIAFHCGGDALRALVRDYLNDYANDYRLSYTSGVLPLPEYAKAMSRARVTVNQSRESINRPHRVLDALACNTCLLTSKLPIVSGEWLPSRAYAAYETLTEFEQQLNYLFKNPVFRQETAEYGHNIVMRHHTWRVRAAQLREMLDAYFRFDQ